MTIAQTPDQPSKSPLPPLSALQETLSRISLSSSPSKSSSSSSNHSEAYLHLAVQIAHNLRYQHDWTNLSLHLAESLPRPLISGLPPRRLYIHPDEQIELLQRQKAEGKVGMPEMQSEREWVLPTRLREKWSLRKFAEVFDVLSFVPPAEGGERKLFEEDWEGVEEEVNAWRTEKAPKRASLATVDDDSTVMYYVVHDGMVKPRQN